MTCIDSSVILISEKLSIISPTIIANGRETKSWPSGTELVYMIGRMSNVPATMDSTINCRELKTRLSAITITDKRRANSIVMHMTKQQIKKMNATPALLPLTAKRSYFKLPGVSITLGKFWEDSAGDHSIAAAHMAIVPTIRWQTSTFAFMSSRQW